MSCKDETRSINGHEYYCRQWDADKAFLMKFRLTKILGPALAELATAIGSKKKGEDKEKEQVDALSNGMTKLFASAKPEELLGLIKEVVCSCTRDGERFNQSDFALAYQGELREPYMVFLFVIGLNYSDFFGGQSVEGLLAKATENL